MKLSCWTGRGVGVWQGPAAKARHLVAARRALFLLMLLFGSVVGGADDPVLGLRVEDVSAWSDASSFYLPTAVRVTNRGAPRQLAVTVRARGRDGRLVESVLAQELPAGRSRLDVPVLTAVDWGATRISFTVDGAAAPALELPGGYLRRTADAVVLAFGAGGVEVQTALEREQLVLGLRGRLRRSRIKVLTAPQAPRRWQCYVGLRGLAVMGKATVDALETAQRTALADWVAWGGGVLWFHGEEPRGMMRACGLWTGRRRTYPGALDVEMYACGTGKLILSSSASLEALSERDVQAMVFARESGLREDLALWAGLDQDRGYGWRRGSSSERPGRLQRLLEGLHAVPVGGLCAVSMVLALLIGPANFLLLRRLGRPLLFYLTAPLLAAVGVGLLVAYSMAAEGWTPRYREEALLLHRGAGEAGAVYQRRGIYAAYRHDSGLRYPGTTLALPLHGAGPGESRLALAWGSGLQLGQGWLPARQAAGLVTVTPIAVRLGVHVWTAADGGVMVRNDLPAAASWVRARVRHPGSGGPTEYWAHDVQPGVSVEMGCLEERPPREEFPFIDLDELNWSVCARTAGLAYLEDGGLAGECVDGSYYYVSLSGAGE